MASPRPSITSLRSPITSSRTSLDTSTTATRPPRRNRAALRDYYNIKPSAGNPANGSHNNAEEEADIDKAGFDAEAYVASVLANEGLEGVLRVEAGLVAEVRGLDGERKALVYDNYGRLISATDTIRRMRTNMDPLTPATSTLSPAISHIAESAASLSASLTGHIPQSPAVDTRDLKEQVKERERLTVRWVLDAPRRLERLISDGKTEEAEEEWVVVEALLDKWKGVEGVESVREVCEEVINRSDEE